MLSRWASRRKYINTGIIGYLKYTPYTTIKIEHSVSFTLTLHVLIEISVHCTVEHWFIIFNDVCVYF